MIIDNNVRIHLTYLMQLFKVSAYTPTCFNDLLLFINSSVTIETHFVSNMEGIGAILLAVYSRNFTICITTPQEIATTLFPYILFLLNVSR